jgi:hypothetical protein
MKNYNEIKNKELIVTKHYSDKKLDKYIWNCKFLRKLFGETFFWIISCIPFIIIPGIFILIGFLELDIITVFLFTFSHLLFWLLKGKKEAIKVISETLPELELTIEVLEDIRKERNG